MTKLVLSVYITAFTMLAVMAVGKVPETCGEPYSYSLPIIVFSMLFIPALLGIIAASED